MTNRVSLAELAAADIPLRPVEAVTVVAELCRQHARGEISGIPSPGIIWVTREGQVMAPGPMTREEASVSRAAHLLNDLLPGIDAPGDYRASGGLRLVIARALGSLDLPPYACLADFVAGLTRFAGADPGATARDLFRRWEACQATPQPPVAATALTISDLRHVSEDPEQVTALVPSGPQAVARIAPAVRRRARSPLASSALAVAVAALLALATFSIVIGSGPGGRPVQAGASNATSPIREARPVESSAAVAAPALGSPAPTRRRVRRLAQASAAIATPAPESPAPLRRRVRRSAHSSAVISSPGPESPDTASGVHRRAPDDERPAARPRSFFSRELFRIVIK